MEPALGLEAPKATPRRGCEERDPLPMSTKVPRCGTGQLYGNACLQEYGWQTSQAGWPWGTLWQQRGSLPGHRYVVTLMYNSDLSTVSSLQ